MIHEPLPNLPSRLIRIAIEDLHACEADPRYAVDMSTWHTPDGDVCAVCLAGAVMAKRLEVPPDIRKTPSMFWPQPETMRALEALEALRSGLIADALRMLEQPPAFAAHNPNRGITPYELNPIRFEEDLLDLADEFERAGL